MTDPSIKDQIVTIEWMRREKSVQITGIYGTEVVRDDNPVEIGLRALEVMTGEKLAPPIAYRKCEEEQE